MPADSSAFDDPDERDEPGPDESYCSSCGEVIKSEAEVCPECGVRQPDADSDEEDDYSIPDTRQYELEKIANKDVVTTMVVSLLLTPIGYYMVGKTGLAIINFLTFNYLLLGPIIVPLHTRKIIKDARSELNRAGVDGY